MKKLRDMDKLAKKLKAMNKPVYNDAAGLKSRIMHSISAEEEFVENLKSTMGGVQIDPNMKARLKIKLMDKIDEMSEVMAPSRWFPKLVSLLASGTLVIFAGVYLYLFDSVVFVRNSVFATVLTEVSGDVYVIRDGQTLPAYKNMLLQEQDIVATGKQGAASIKYIDESVSRLNGDSSVKLSKLFSHSKKKTLTVVEIELIQGDIWNRVVNIVEDDGSEFRVKANKVSTEASRKAAFNVKTDPDGGVKVKVVENVVDVKSETVKKVAEGYEAVVDDNIVVDHIKGENDEDKNWVAENLEKDQTYIKEIVENKKEERKKMVGALPDSVLYPIKEIKTDTKLLLTLDETKKEELKFDVANRRLQEAQVLIDQGNADEAEPIVQEFKTQAEEFSKYIGDLEKVDPDLALDLKIKLNDTIDGNLKDLEPIEQSDPLYSVKESLIETEAKIQVAAVDDEKEDSKTSEVDSEEKEETDNAEVIADVKAPEEVSDDFVSEGLNLEDVPLASYFVESHPAAPKNKYKEAIEAKIESSVETVAPYVFNESDDNLANPEGIEPVETDVEVAPSSVFNASGEELN